MLTPKDEGGAGETAAAPVAATPQGVGLHGPVAAFHTEQENWSERQHCFTANDIAFDHKRRARRNAVGAST